MTAVQAFWHFLYLLQHATQLGSDMQAAPGGQIYVITYGGNALQAFLNALYSHGTEMFVWLGG